MLDNDTSRDKTPLGILFSILTSFQVLQRYFELELSRHDATPIRFAVMSALFKYGGEMTVSQIAQSVYRRTNTVSSVIDTLEKEGAVRREKSRTDGRSVSVVITDFGWQQANRLTPINQEISREVLSCLDREQVEALVSTMRTIRRNLLPRIAGGREKGKDGCPDGGG